MLETLSEIISMHLMETMAGMTAFENVHLQHDMEPATPSNDSQRTTQWRQLLSKALSNGLVLLEIPSDEIPVSGSLRENPVEPVR